MYDCIVVGLGVYGLSTLYQLSKAGLNVMGVDQDSVPNDNNSSHGKTRMLRFLSFEGKGYLRTVQRSLEIIQGLEQEHSVKLFNQCGFALLAGDVQSGAHGTSGIFEIIKELHDRDDLRTGTYHSRINQKYPQFGTNNLSPFYFERDAGFMYADRLIKLLKQISLKHNAVIREQERVITWEPQRHGYTVTTTAGIYQAKKLVITTGPWITKLINKKLPFDRLKVTKQRLFWFEIENFNEFTPDVFPCFVTLPTEKRPLVYGFPVLPENDEYARPMLKIGVELKNPKVVDPDDLSLERMVKNREYKIFQNIITKTLPGIELGGQWYADCCMYTEEQNGKFIIHQDEQVWYISACSGHGFKHSLALGEKIAELVRI